MTEQRITHFHHSFRKGVENCFKHHYIYVMLYNKTNITEL